MVLTKHDFLIKAGLLVAAVAVSSLHWSITMNPDGEALFHLGSLLAFAILVPIIAVIPGALFFGGAALTMNQRTRDHTRACFLMGLYVVALLMVSFNVLKIADMPRPSSARGDGRFFWYVAYAIAFIYSLPGVRVIATQQEIDQQKAHRQKIARRPGINRWLVLGGASLLVFTTIFLIFRTITDLNEALLTGGILGAGTAVILAFLMLLNDAVFGRLRFWKTTFPRSEDRVLRAWERKTQDSSSNSGDRAQPNSNHIDHHFQILEIHPGATIGDVKAAYRRQMQQYHPDKVASLGKELRDLAEAKSKEIDKAYRAIMDALSAIP